MDKPPGDELIQFFLEEITRRIRVNLVEDKRLDVRQYPLRWEQMDEER